MLSKSAVFLLAVALPAIQGFGLGGDNNMLSSKLGSLINGGDNNKPITTTSTYTLPPPSTITISPVTPPTATYTNPTTSPIIYYTPTYVPTPFPVPIIAPNDEMSPVKEEMADAVDQDADGGRRRKRVQRVFPKRKRRLTKSKAARRNRRRG